MINKIIFPNTGENRKIDNKVYKPKYKIRLLFGDVQSGKTKYVFNKVILDSVKKNFYSRIIFLSGNMNILHNQSCERIYSDDTMNKIKKYGWFREEKSNKSINSKYVNRIQFMKTTTTDLDNLSFLKTTKRKVLFIIDECDYAAFDNKKKFNEGKINQMIININKNKNIFFYLLSATPYRNIYGSENNIMCPQKILYNKSYSGYCGFKYISQWKKNHLSKLN